MKIPLYLALKQFGEQPEMPEKQFRLYKSEMIPGFNSKEELFNTEIVESFENFNDCLSLLSELQKLKNNNVYKIKEFTNTMVSNNSIHWELSKIMRFY